MSRRTNSSANADRPAARPATDPATDASRTPEGRAVVVLRNGTTEEREAAVVLDGPEPVVRQATLAPGEAAVVTSPVEGGPVTAEVHAEDASASFTFDPDTAPVPPLFTLRGSRVLVAFE
jgi:hypothetical protein